MLEVDRPRPTADYDRNGFFVGLAGSYRREILDPVIVFNEEHLRRLLREYVSDYNAERLHARLRNAPEESRASDGF